MFFASVILIMPAFAQSMTNGSISGKLMVNTGEMPPGLNMTLLNATNLSIEYNDITAIVDNDGYFLFSSVPPGDYVLSLQPVLY